jgi:hypothetical protein
VSPEEARQRSEALFGQTGGEDITRENKNKREELERRPGKIRRLSGFGSISCSHLPGCARDQGI